MKTKSLFPWLLVTAGALALLWSLSSPAATSSAQRIIQQKFEVLCPEGSYAVPWGIGLDSATGNYVQNACIGSGGDLFFPNLSNAVVAHADFLDQSAGLTDTTIYTAPSTTGMYRAEYASFLVDNSGASLVVNPIVAWYQHGIRIEQQLAGFSENGIGSFGNSGVAVFWPDPGTVIQYAANQSGFTTGSGNFYDLHITIEKVR